jgi:hypothetical protein
MRGWQAARWQKRVPERDSPLPAGRQAFKGVRGMFRRVQACLPAGRVQAAYLLIPQRRDKSRLYYARGPHGRWGKPPRLRCATLGDQPPIGENPSTSLRYARGPGANRKKPLDFAALRSGTTRPLEKKGNDVHWPPPSALRRFRSVPSPLLLPSFLAPSPFRKGADRGMTEE